MPRHMDGPQLEEAPAGVTRNAEARERFEARVGNGEHNALRPNADHGGVLQHAWSHQGGDQFGDASGPVRVHISRQDLDAHLGPQFQQQAGRNAGSDAELAALVDAGMADAAVTDGQHAFAGGGVFSHGGDHFNSQALSMHADWFMI